RRAYLHILGALPTPDEATRFLTSKHPARYARLIEELLARPEYADYWATQWDGLLGMDSLQKDKKAREAFLGWLRRAFAENSPLDHISRALLRPQGELRDTPAVAFYLAHKKPEVLAETTARAFLGVNLGCAACHAQPHRPWDRDAYHGLSACFARVKLSESRKALSPHAAGVYPHPLTKRNVPAAAPGESAFPAAGQQDPRKAL